MTARDVGDAEAAAIGWLTPVRAALLIWAVLTLAALAARWPAIEGLRLIDPDDSMRMAQVRDLLAGQGWWDLHQYRVNPAGGGVLMHWSRIVDAPIAAGIWLLTPLFGQAGAERIVMALWPPMLGGLLFVASALGLRNLSDRRIAFVAPLFLAFSGFILAQFQPLRVDHHGWQIFLAMLMLWQAIRPAGAGAGILGGLFGALLLAISIEGLPIVALFAALAALRWALHARADDRDRFGGYMAALAGGAVLFQFLTRGPGGLSGQWCDSLSAPYLASIAAAALVSLPILWVAPRQRWVRFLLLAVAAGLAAGALISMAPQCANGPFASLDPIVVQYWYRNISEGQPLWASSLYDAIYVLLPSLVGLAGSVLAWRGSDVAAARRNWATIILALLGATILSLLVLRTVSTAHVFALPGGAWLGLRVWDKARAIRAPLPRVLASTMTALTLPMLGSVAASMMIAWVYPGLLAENSQRIPAGAATQTCLDADVIAQLNHMAPTTILAPIDLGGSLVFWTHHSLVATGHHRNGPAMADTIRAFIGDSARAESLVRKQKASLIVFCRTASDLAQYRQVRKDGLAAQLYMGRPPAWLEAVPIGGKTGLSVWRVKPR